MPTLLTIAGFDPSSGAGVTADLAVFAAHGLFGTAAITACTVQSTVSVRSVHATEQSVLRDTLSALEDDLPADGIKIGMLATAGCVAAVLDFVRRLHHVRRRPVIVLDPVLRSSSGRALLDDAGFAAMQNDLLGCVDWITPNVEELQLLCDLEVSREKTGHAEITSLAEILQRRFSTLGMVVTGGHLESPDDLFLPPPGHPDREPTWLPGEWVHTSATHGTGCAFSSALLCNLVVGEMPVAAARKAKAYVAEAMRRAQPRGRGHGPMEHLWPLRDSLK